jgi:hypothetical protein
MQHAGDRDKESSYRRSAEPLFGQFGPDARREIELTRREQLRGKRA